MRWLPSPLPPLLAPSSCLASDGLVGQTGCVGFILLCPSPPPTFLPRVRCPSGWAGRAGFFCIHLTLSFAYLAIQSATMYLMRKQIRRMTKKKMFQGVGQSQRHRCWLFDHSRLFNRRRPFHRRWVGNHPYESQGPHGTSQKEDQDDQRSGKQLGGPPSCFSFSESSWPSSWLPLRRAR